MGGQPRASGSATSASLTGPKITTLGWMFRVLARNIHPNKLINRHMRSKNTVSGDDTQSWSLLLNGRRRVA
jgi:hypothetical protein